ncbi:MAG: hypothetical protein J6L70_00460 [Alphaproteobacteria bacterium]|nr:hypothetical protein [Alphaproteobacteria bacterium]
MKKIRRLLFLTGIFTIICVPGYAVYECVRYSPYDTVGSSTSEEYGVEWVLTLNSTRFRGLAICSNIDKNTESYPFLSGSNNTYCWCKIISPGQSYWIVANDYTTVSDCDVTCASNCETLMRNKGIFSGLVATMHEF